MAHRGLRVTATQVLRALNMGDCQNYGPPVGPLNTRTQKGTILLTTSHMDI